VAAGAPWLDKPSPARVPSAGVIHGKSRAGHRRFSRFYVCLREVLRRVSRPALLVLADGTRFDGMALGASGMTVGEVVFNTAMTGYQEILSDPSYAQQMVTLTVPHVGNTGANAADVESRGVFATGLIVRDVPIRHSSFRAEESLDACLCRQGIIAITDVDTRALTRHLRDSGAQGGCIMSGDGLDAVAAHGAAQAFPGLAGMDLAKVVTCETAYTWNDGVWKLAGSGDTGPEVAPPEGGGTAGGYAAGPHVVAMDFGVKYNILRMLVERGCRVTVVPATASADEIRALAPDGLFLSNGPGDPEPCDYAVAAIRTLLDEDRLPTFGICLGHQLLALASGAATRKMKFGHHGANHPVLDIESGRVMISSQNHGFSVDAETLGNHVEVTHTSLFDGSLQGIRRRDVPAFGFQGHPEASPGPHDVAGLFDSFVAMLPSR